VLSKLNATSSAPPRPLFTCQDRARSEAPLPQPSSASAPLPRTAAPRAARCSPRYHHHHLLFPVASRAPSCSRTREGERSASCSASSSHRHAAGAGKAAVKEQGPWQQRGTTLSECYLEERLERALFRTSGVSSDVGTAGDPPNSDLLSLSDAVSPSSLFSDSDSCKLKSFTRHGAGAL